MARKQRDYSAEYQRRNELAKQRGFRSYGQQRRYTEYTATPASYIVTVTPEELRDTYVSHAYHYDEYEWGDDPLLDAWLKRSQVRGIDEEEAFLSYKRAARGGSLSRNQIKRLSQRLYGDDWDEKWSTS